MTWNGAVALLLRLMAASLLISLAWVVGMGRRGCQPYLHELQGRPRQAIGFVLLVAILGLIVFMPVLSVGEGAPADLAESGFASLFLAHYLLLAFAVVWLLLRGQGGLEVFWLHRGNYGSKIVAGIRAGILGWMATLAITASVAIISIEVFGVAAPEGVPPAMDWIAELGLARKFVIVAVAMTVEELFFRGFLQPRFGELSTSVLFACSHFSWGLPFLVVGVFVFSLILGRTLAREGDLLPCIVAHGVFDTIQLVVIVPMAVQSLPVA